MSGPDRIWIDVWGGNWSLRSDGTQIVEYLNADLVAQQIAVAEAAAYERMDQIITKMNATVAIAHAIEDGAISDEYHLAWLSQALDEMNEGMAEYAAIRARGEGKA